MSLLLVEDSPALCHFVHITTWLKSDYQIFAEITYNTFPWPDNPANKNQIEAAAQTVLYARNNHPTASLADLYHPKAMPKDLAEAYRTLDGLVLAA
jgi:hypothetical protein